MQQVIVGQNTSGNRIFNCHYTAITFFFIPGNFYYLPECSTTYHFHFPAIKLAGCFLMKTSLTSLSTVLLLATMSHAQDAAPDPLAEGKKNYMLICVACVTAEVIGDRADDGRRAIDR